MTSILQYIINNVYNINNRYDSSDLELKKEEEYDITCSICSFVFYEPCILKCGHIFCKGCIKTWFFNYNKSCPICRTECKLVKIILNVELKNRIDELTVKKCHKCNNKHTVVDKCHYECKLCHVDIITQGTYKIFKHLTYECKLSKKINIKCSCNHIIKIQYMMEHVLYCKIFQIFTKRFKYIIKYDTSVENKMTLKQYSYNIDFLRNFMKSMSYVVPEDIYVRNKIIYLKKKLCTMENNLQLIELRHRRINMIPEPEIFIEPRRYHASDAPFICNINIPDE